MAGKADFSEEEWDALQKGVTGAGMLVSVAHRDFTDSFGEAKAIAKHLAGHTDSESQLKSGLLFVFSVHVTVPVAPPTVTGWLYGVFTVAFGRKVVPGSVSLSVS